MLPSNEPFVPAWRVRTVSHQTTAPECLGPNRAVHNNAYLYQKKRKKTLFKCCVEGTCRRGPAPSAASTVANGLQSPDGNSEDKNGFVASPPERRRVRRGEEDKGENCPYSPATRARNTALPCRTVAQKRKKKCYLRTSWDHSRRTPRIFFSLRPSPSLPPVRPSSLLPPRPPRSPVTDPHHSISLPAQHFIKDATSHSKYASHT